MAQIYKQNFLGQAGFIWWIGVVENRKDPLNIGRCQIRIFGWHTDDLTLIPSADLPWAHPVMPINDSRNFNTPKEGDYVVGFFFDGESGQFPGYLGVLPGIPKSAALQSEESPQKGFQDLRTSSDLSSSPSAPKQVTTPTDGSGASVVDQPAQRNPSVAGFPNVPPLAINDPNNPPAAIKNRIDALVKDISGPENKNLADSIAGAVQGAAAALTGAIPNLNSLVPDAAALSSSIISTTPVTVPIDLTSGFVDPLKQAAAKAQAEIEAAQAQLAKTQSAVQAQIAEAAAAAQKAAASAQSALSQGLSDLQSKASSISDSINAKLSSLSSGSVNTTHTVTLIDGVPNVDANGLTVPLNKVNTVATQLETQLKNLQQSLTNLLSQ